MTEVRTQLSFMLRLVLKHRGQPMWMAALQTAWQLDPAIGIFLTERCKHAAVHNEVGRLVRSNTRDVIDVPEALRFLLGDINVRRDLKVCL